jgi:hypothetical protein
MVKDYAVSIESALTIVELTGWARAGAEVGCFPPARRL